MSRIEEAMEKARKLREHDAGTAVGNGPDRANLSRKAEPVEPDMHLQRDVLCSVQREEHAQESLSFLNRVPQERIEITNPLILAANYDDQPVAEEYRKLKSAIVFTSKKEGFKNTLMVTSSISGEGKTITSLNLAISLAQEHNHTVLLVDADLRKPSICKYLGLEPKSGLADCLMDDMDIGEALIKTGWGNLSLLPAGKQMDNPVELFSSQRMKDLLDELKHRYPDRYIIIDTPPVLPFAETRLLGTLVDGVIFVVKEGGTSLEHISEAMDALKSANVMGTVYNEATLSSLDNGYGYYPYGYSYRNRGDGIGAPGTNSKPGFIARFLKSKVRT